MISGAVLIIFLFLRSLSTAPISVAQGQSIELDELGILDVKNHNLPLPHAYGNGVDNDTAVLQELIDYGYRNRMAVVFPEGTYLITDTLVMVQQETNSQRRYFSHQLIGSTRGKQPVIRLAPNSPGFDGTSQSQTKPALKFIALCSEDESVDGCGTDEWGTARSINFESGIRNFTIDIGEGNSGAVGINFSGSQQSFIEDITINVGDGFAGMMHVPGLASVIGNITVNGGKYGIYNSWYGYTNGTTFTNLRLIDQTECSLGY